MQRIKLLSIFFLLAFMGVIARLFYWQIIKSEDLSAQASEQYQASNVIQAPRGNIFASDGTWLAARTTSYLVYAALPEIKGNKQQIADKLAPFFVEDSEDKTQLLNEVGRIYSLLNKNDVVWVPLKKQIKPDIKKQIESMEIAGIGFEKEEARAYPEASVAAQLLGFVGKNDIGENVGYFGLEGNYNLPLSGKPGFSEHEKDAAGTPLVFGENQEVSAISGTDLITHIDKTIQIAVDQKLKDGIEKYGATAGTAIVMRPSDGAILAMSSYPSYDPSSYSKFTYDLFKNPAISDAFEPGSVFKTVVMASALDAGVIDSDTKCECSGPVKIDKYSIETWDHQYHPDSTMSDVIKHSDNVGMVFVGERLGLDKLYDYIKAFGFGTPTGIDLQGEASPALRDKGKWGLIDLATATFGQGIAVTPIQMVTAISTIANHGNLVEPQVVDKLSSDGWEEDLPQAQPKRVISKEAADKITAMMIDAAKNGEAKWTSLRGFSVAGKTGTAQIPISGHYDAEKTIASFVGFAPADDPQFVMLVTLKEPKTSTWASETAAPLWYSIAKDIFMHLGIQPEN